MAPLVFTGFDVDFPTPDSPTGCKQSHSSPFAGIRPHKRWTMRPFREATTDGVNGLGGGGNTWIPPSDCCYLALL